MRARSLDLRAVKHSTLISEINESQNTVQSKSLVLKCVLAAIFALYTYISTALNKRSQPVVDINPVTKRTPSERGLWYSPTGKPIM